MKEKTTAKHWIWTVILTTASILIFLAATTAAIDPFLHYHLPLKGLAYPLMDPRYQNDGISRHYQYDSIITGTSMTQNFKTSEFNSLWNADAIKITYSGASYKEINDNILRALSYQSEIRYVLRSLDGSMLIYPADQNEYDNYPNYLYDNNPFNDLNYLLNKDVVPKTLAVLNYTRAGNKTPSMDEYSSWSQYKTFGKDEVFRTLPQLPTFEEDYVLTNEDIKNISENVRMNVLQCVKDNPQITFYTFFPPYSICYWHSLMTTKQLRSQLEAEEMAVKILLEADNVHIFAFADETEMIANLDNYTDSLHYGEWINSNILEWMRNGEHELTKENYKDYYENLYNLYQNYDYSWLN